MRVGHRVGRFQPTALGKVDVLVRNAAYQMNRSTLEEVPDEEWDFTFATNVSAMFHPGKAGVPHMPPGSVNSDMPFPALAPYAATKAAIANLCAAWRRCWGTRGSG